MFIRTNTYLRQGITGVTFSHPRRRQYFHRLTGTGSYFPACLDVFNLTRLGKLHSHANKTHKGFIYKKISSEFMEKPGSNLVIKENMQDLPLSSAYETVMEALSSLITIKKRGDRPAVEPKYGKLDGMLMYIKTKKCRLTGFSLEGNTFELPKDVTISKNRLPNIFDKELLYDLLLGTTDKLLATRVRHATLAAVQCLHLKNSVAWILGLEEHIAGLNIIHVAGTKGKGSTCTFCEAILRESGFKTGLFTSPHLIDVRERFRLDGLDISVEKFLVYFWECWNQLKESISEDLPMPPLFQFFTLLAFKIFISEKVDVAIIEVGLGGENDSTNVIKKPVVCGITSLGMDHMETLGDTLGQIASQKAGIFKPQVPAFTVLQLSEAMNVIQARACELMIPLEVVPPLDPRTLGGQTLGLSGEHQFINAGLAVSLCKSWLRSTGNWQKLFLNSNQDEILPEAFLRGLSTACLSGRAQIIHEPSLSSCSSSEVKANSSGNLVFYLDGAHSPESMEACARWFSSAVKVNKHLSSSPSSYKVVNVEKLGGNDYTHHEMDKESGKILKRVLLFNCMEVRDPQILLPQLVNACASSGTHFSKAIFVPSMSTYGKVTSGMSVIPEDTLDRDLSWQFNLQKIWEKMIHGKDAVADKGSKTDGLQTLPPHEFLYQDSSHCNPADRHFACSAVIPTLPLTINWLRDCAKRYPSLRVQVLVTGSIHLVGDVLKLLRR